MVERCKFLFFLIGNSKMILCLTNVLYIPERISFIPIRLNMPFSSYFCAVPQPNV